MKNFPYSGLVHVRTMDDLGGVAANGGITFVYDIVETAKDGFYFLLSAACCSDKDNFNRKIGRSIATGRMDMFSSLLKFDAPKKVSGVPSVFEDFFAAYPLIDVVGDHNIRAAEDAIVRTEDGVIYIREKNFALVDNLIDGFFIEVLYSLYGDEFEIVRLGSNFIAVPMEYDGFDDFDIEE